MIASGQVPRLSARVMAWSLPEADRAAVLGDLSEEFLSRAELDLHSARRWYRRQVRRSLAANLRRKSAESIGGSMRDVRDAVRALRAAPGFTVVALIVLAFGIGASTLIFSMVDAVVLRALPFDEGDRIVSVGSLYNGRPGLETAPTFLEWRERQTAFESLTAIEDGTLILNAGTEAEEVRLERVTAEFFSVLRVRPRLGQPFTADEEVEGRDRVAIISDALWRSHFGADPSIVGKSMPSNIGTRTIIGVMPPDFGYPVGALRPTHVWVPYVVPAKERDRATASRVFTLQLLARLRPGLDAQQAQAQIQQMTDRVIKQYPKWFGASGTIGVTPLRELMVGDVRSWMLMLLGAVAVVLLLACVNVAALTLARASGRTQQLAIRAVLGASRFRISRGVLTESLVLSGLGAACGVVLAWGGMSILRAAMPATIPRVSSIALNGRVLWFAVCASVATGISVGIVPAWQASRASVFGLLKDSGRSLTAGRRPRRMRVALVVAEVTLAVVLLVGAGLFVSSFLRLMRVDVGFDYRRVLTVAVSARPEDATWKARGPAIATDIVDRLTHMAGVESVAAISQGLPLTGLRHRVPVLLATETVPAADPEPVELRAVSSNYFATLGIAIQRGRGFADDDRDDAPLVTVLSEEASRKYFGRSDALGATIAIDGRDRTVIGVVRGVRLGGPETDTQPLAYEPLMQSPGVRAVDLAIRTDGDPLALLPDVKPVVWSVDPELTIRSATTLDAIFDRLTAVRQFNMLLVSLFGLVGIAVAAAGIYGVVASDVGARTHEIAVRMALGARRSQVVTDVLAGVTAYVGLGLTIGLIGAAALATLIKAFLFEVQPHDVGVYALVAVILAGSGLLAAWLPARRAAAIDPLISIKH